LGPTPEHSAPDASPEHDKKTFSAPPDFPNPGLRRSSNNPGRPRASPVRQRAEGEQGALDMKPSKIGARFKNYVISMPYPPMPLPGMMEV
jgi:hypothetical protein